MSEFSSQRASCERLARRLLVPTTQCCTTIGVCGVRMHYDVPPLHAFPDSIAVTIMTFFPGTFIRNSLRNVDQAWSVLSYHHGLWLVLCHETSKVPAHCANQIEQISRRSTSCEYLSTWEVFYWENPAVPTDYPTISTALKHAGDGCRVMVSKGTYKENLLFERSVDLIATGAVVLMFETLKPDVPAIKVTAGDVKISQFSLGHSSTGKDLWNGNSCIFADGECRLTLLNCKVVSKSGRGIVGSRGSVLNVTDCHIHDSAATGVYIGSPQSRAVFSRCIIENNGGGSSRVQRGHSGIFVDRSRLEIYDSKIMRNFLSGVSVVGESGFAVISDCNFLGNARDSFDAPAGQVELRGINSLEAQ